MRVWDLATGQQQAKLTGHDGAVLVGGGHRGRGQGGQRRRRRHGAGVGPGHRPAAAELTGHDGPVRSVAVTADGARAVSGGGDGTVRVWDLATGQQQAKLTGHDGPVRSVAVTADGARAVSGGDDGTVRVWDLATGKEVACWTGDHAVIACTALPGQPFKIAVGQQRAQPYLLELRGQENTR